MTDLERWVCEWMLDYTEEEILYCGLAFECGTEEAKVYAAAVIGPAIVSRSWAWARLHPAPKWEQPEPGPNTITIQVNYSGEA